MDNTSGQSEGGLEVRNAEIPWLVDQIDSLMSQFDQKIYLMG